MGTPRDEQKAKVLAFLLLSEVTGNRCTVEDLSCSCLTFYVSADEIRTLCKLPNVPLRLLDNDRVVEVAKSFDIRINSLVSLLHNQVNNTGTGAAKHVVDIPASRKDEFVVAKTISTPEPLVVRSDFEGVSAIQPEPAVIEIRTQANPGNPLQRIDDSSLAIDDGNLCDRLERAEKAHLATPQVENPNAVLQRIEDSCLAILDGNLCDRLERAEKAHLATPQVENPNTVLQRIEDSCLAILDGYLCDPLERAEKTPLATAAVNLAEQGAVPLLKKSPASRSVPRFEDYDVDCEVGAGGYGTVYKVRRHLDGQVFAMKCPLENTHDSNVRNEIDMLKRLRGKDYIIQIQNEVTGKVSPKPDTGGGEEVNCPSILLDFIEHDKPEILKKAITIDELKWYCVSLFKALVQLHEERILHLDVKPGNFLFSRSSKKGCLVDFNLARDESAKRLSTRRPERCSSRPVTDDSKTSERRECPKRTRGNEDAPRTCVKPSKRSRTICKNVGMLLQSRPDSATDAITAPVKHAEPCKVNESLDNTGSSKKTTKQKLRGMAAGNHRLANILRKVVDKASYPSTAPGTQITVVSAIKANPNKRVPAELPPRPQSVQPSSAKRVKPVLRVKAPCHQVKDGPCVGTKGYRAPEVLMRSTKQTTKVDIWSAGVSLLQLVTGRSPFPSTCTEGALRDIAKLRGAVPIDNLAKSLGQRHLFFSKDKPGQPYPGVSVKEWSDKHSRRTDLKGRIPSTLYDLIDKCLDVNPSTRITAEAALLHQFCSIDETAEVSKHPNLS